MERTAQSTPTRQTNAPSYNISPVQSSITEHNFVLLPNVRNIPATLSSRVEPTWRAKPVVFNKFVDDNLASEKLYMKDAEIIENQDEYFKNVRAGGSENMFNHITRRAEAKGLKVNSCLLYTSPSPRDQRGSRMPSSA